VNKGVVYGKNTNLNEKSVASSKMWRAIQLKHYRRTNGLCYMCGVKFIA
jgi:hypothetical protein